MLKRYAEQAGLDHRFTAQAAALPADLAGNQDLDDAPVQPYNGHASRQALEVYSRLALGEAPQEDDRGISRLPD